MKLTSLARLRCAPPLPFGRDTKALSLPKLGVQLISRAVRHNRTVSTRMLIGLLLVFGCVPSSRDEKRADLEAEIAEAETVEYCRLLDNHLTYKSKMLRVRALYETDFEKSALTARACSTSILRTWVDLQEGWESRTSSRVRRAFNSLAKKWGRQADVVFMLGPLAVSNHFRSLTNDHCLTPA